MGEISRLISSSKSTVLKYLKEFGITRREMGAKNRSRLGYGEAWQNRQVVPNQRELENIEKMRQLRSQGFSYWKSAEVFNSMKIPTKTRRGHWHARSIQQILEANGQER